MEVHFKSLIVDVTKREFSFTLDNGSYLRYLSFSSLVEFTESLKKLRPKKIDIGAIYNLKPSERKSFSASSLIPLSKELVFDIDVSDYDNFRNCCQGKGMCRLCWKYCRVAIEFLDETLRSRTLFLPLDDFGFEDLMWVFSGRRGVHCWVSDATAVSLKSSSRASLLHYLEIPVVPNSLFWSLILVF